MSELSHREMGGKETKERRRSQRFLLRGDTRFEWRSVAGQWLLGMGVTRNVGREGAFVETKTVPPMASQLKVVVTLTGGSSQEFRARLCGTGVVRHIHREGGVSSGFGASVSFHTEVPEPASC